METDLVSSVIKSVVLLLLFHWKLKVRIVPVVKSIAFVIFVSFLTLYTMLLMSCKVYLKILYIFYA